jgi:hypothetical protein
VHGGRLLRALRDGERARGRAEQRDDGGRGEQRPEAPLVPRERRERTPQRPFLGFGRGAAEELLKIARDRAPPAVP